MVAVHVDDGVTPMFLGCRAIGCVGTAVSLGYPQGIPPEVLGKLAWEWCRLSRTQLKRARREEPAMYRHAMQGGLKLDRLSDRGRQALALRPEVAR